MAARTIAWRRTSCHGLAPWRFTLTASLVARLFSAVSRKREPPRGKPVAFPRYSRSLWCACAKRRSTSLTIAA